jgi:hypothetical protein
MIHFKKRNHKLFKNHFLEIMKKIKIYVKNKLKYFKGKGNK